MAAKKKKKKKESLLFFFFFLLSLEFWKSENQNFVERTLQSKTFFIFGFLFSL